MIDGGESGWGKKGKWRAGGLVCQEGIQVC